MEDPKILNRRLVEYYGRHDNRRPLFRLVWSKDQYEWRRTVRAKTTNSGLITGFEKGDLHLPKYEFLPPCWVLEKLEFNVPPDLLNSHNGSYEPLWPFLDKEDQPQEPSWEMIAHAIDFLVYGKAPKVDIEKWAENKELEEFNKLYKEMGGDEDPDVIRRRISSRINIEQFRR